MVGQVPQTTLSRRASAATSARATVPFDEFRQAFGAAHVFYGETHVINPPPRYWTLPFSATCERCGAESPLVLSIWDLRLEGWEEDVLSHVWFCRSCAPIATEERIRAVRDMFVEAELHRWLDERFDLCGC